MSERARKLQDGESLFDRLAPAVVRPNRHVGHVMDATSTTAYRDAMREGREDQRSAIVEAYYRSRGPAGSTDADAARDLVRLHPGTEKNSWSPARNRLWHEQVVLKTERVLPTRRADGTLTNTKSRVHVHRDHATPAEREWAWALWHSEFDDLAPGSFDAVRKAWDEVQAAMTDEDQRAANARLVQELGRDRLFDHLLKKSP